MSPKEQAKKLKEDFNDALTLKDCALVAVNQIWNALESARAFEEYNYWQEVKQEIKEL